MKIGFDAKRLFHNFTGLGNYSRSLVRNLHRYSPESLDLHFYAPKTSDHPRVREFLNSQKYTVHTKGTGPSALWRSYGIRKDLVTEGLDIYHGLSHELPFGIRKTRITSVVSMHDLIFLRYPDFYPYLDRQIYHKKFSYAARHADKIIAISESTKADLVNYFGTDPDKIEVIYQACDEQFYVRKPEEEIRASLNKYQLPDTYLLYVGSVTDRKNLLNLVKAIEILPESIKLPLVIIGQGKSYMSKVKEYIHQKGLEKLFLFCERTDFADFPSIYQQAQAFIYPSFFEGFGIPIIEALWSETPVISSKTSSMPEAGGPGSLYIDPDKVEDISQAIEKVLVDSELAVSMKDTGKTFVQQFHGNQLTNQLLNFYRSL